MSLFRFVPYPPNTGGRSKINHPPPKFVGETPQHDWIDPDQLQTGDHQTIKIQISGEVSKIEKGKKMKGLTSIILLFLSFPNSLCAAFKLTLPGGRSISYNGETGVLRIQLEEARTRNSNLVVPPIGTRPSNEVMNSIQVRDTKVKEKGFGAFAIREIEKHAFLGMYEGEIIRSREALDAAVNVRATTIRKSGSDDRLKTNAMDYIMSLDGGATFIDGFER